MNKKQNCRERERTKNENSRKYNLNFMYGFGLLLFPHLFLTILMNINDVTFFSSCHLHTRALLTLVYNPMVSYPLPTQQIISLELVYSDWLDAPTASASPLKFSTFSMMDFLFSYLIQMIDAFLCPRRITINGLVLSLNILVCFWLFDGFLFRFNQCFAWWISNCSNCSAE